MNDPWEALRHRPDLLLVRAPISERGRYYPRLRTIVVRAGMLLVEERATLWHELVHADRGDHPDCDERSLQRQERSCVQQAARHAISLEPLAEALLWSDDLTEVADDLKTTTELVQVRLQHLHPSERGYLKQRLGAKEHPA